MSGTLSMGLYVSAALSGSRDFTCEASEERAMMSLQLMYYALGEPSTVLVKKVQETDESRLVYVQSHTTTDG